MLDKLKLLYKLSPVVLAVLFLFSSYIAYVQYQDKQQVKAQAKELSSEIERLYKSINDTNELVAQQEREKIMLENESLELRKELQNALKDNACAVELVPVDVTERLYSHANKIRQSAITK